MYHIMRIRAGAEKKDTCFMTYSDAIPINDAQTPYVALLVYMLLSSDDTHSSLAATLLLTPPPTTQIVDDPGTGPRRDSEEEVVMLLSSPVHGKLHGDITLPPPKPFRQLTSFSPSLYRVLPTSC